METLHVDTDIEAIVSACEMIVNEITDALAVSIDRALETAATEIVERYKETLEK